MPIDLSPEALNRYALLAQMQGEGGQAPAEEPQGAPKGLGVAPWLALIGGQGADAATTAINYGRGLTESNPVYGKHPSLGKVLAVKGAETAGLAALMKMFQKTGHDKAAKVIGYMGGIGGAIPAVINATAKK